MAKIETAARAKARPEAPSPAPCATTGAALGLAWRPPGAGAARRAKLHLDLRGYSHVRSEGR
jgi:hypothetical protein